MQWMVRTRDMMPNSSNVELRVLNGTFFFRNDSLISSRFKEETVERSLKRVSFNSCYWQ